MEPASPHQFALGRMFVVTVLCAVFLGYYKNVPANSIWNGPLLFTTYSAFPLVRVLAMVAAMSSLLGIALLVKSRRRGLLLGSLICGVWLGLGGVARLIYDALSV